MPAGLPVRRCRLPFYSIQIPTLWCHLFHILLQWSPVHGGAMLLFLLSWSDTLPFFLLFLLLLFDALHSVLRILHSMIQGGVEAERRLTWKWWFIIVYLFIVELLLLQYLFILLIHWYHCGGWVYLWLILMVFVFCWLICCCCSIVVVLNCACSLHIVHPQLLHSTVYCCCSFLLFSISDITKFICWFSGNYCSWWLEVCILVEPCTNSGCCILFFVLPGCSIFIVVLRWNYILYPRWFIGWYMHCSCWFCPIVFLFVLPVVSICSRVVMECLPWFWWWYALEADPLRWQVLKALPSTRSLPRFLFPSMGTVAFLVYGAFLLFYSALRCYTSTCCYTICWLLFCSVCCWYCSLSDTISYLLLLFFCCCSVPFVVVLGIVVYSILLFLLFSSVVLYLLFSIYSSLRYSFIAVLYWCVTFGAVYHSLRKVHAYHGVWTWGTHLWESVGAGVCLWHSVIPIDVILPWFILYSVPVTHWYSVEWLLGWCYTFFSCCVGDLEVLVHFLRCSFITRFSADCWCWNRLLLICLQVSGYIHLLRTFDTLLFIHCCAFGIRCYICWSVLGVLSLPILHRGCCSIQWRRACSPDVDCCYCSVVGELRLFTVTVAWWYGDVATGVPLRWLLFRCCCHCAWFCRWLFVDFHVDWKVFIDWCHS